MKKIIPALLALIVFSFIIGCSSDGNGDDNGTTTPRVVANTTVSAPSMNNPNDAIWNQVDSVTIDVSMTNAPRKVAPKVAAVPPSVQVQAIKYSEVLYLRLQWADPSFDAWPNYFYVENITNIVNFTHQGLAEEDQLFVLFEDMADNGYDVWNWRVLTTGAGGLAEDGFFSTSTLQDTVIPDSNGNLGAVVAMDNINTEFTNKPLYVHKDTSEFNHDTSDVISGYALYTDDTLKVNDTLYVRYDSISVGEPPNDSLIVDTIYVTPLTTQGWVEGQRLPSFIIDSLLKNKSTNERGSRWDVKAVSAYNDAANEYTVVLERELNTGHADDLNMGAVDSVKVKIGIYDDQNSFNTGSTSRGYSKEFWLILP